MHTRPSVRVSRACGASGRMPHAAHARRHWLGLQAGMLPVPLGGSLLAAWLEHGAPHSAGQPAWERPHVTSRLCPSRAWPDGCAQGG